MLTRRELIDAGLGTVAAPAWSANGTTAVTARASLGTAQRTYGPIALVGDSLSATNVHDLTVALATHDVGPFVVDVRAGRAINHRAARRFDTGRERVVAIRGRSDPGHWIIALAGNDFERYEQGRTTPRQEIGTLLDLLGPAARVAWPTVWRTRARWQPVCEMFNADLHGLATERSNLTVIEWADVAAPHPEWFRDGVHLHGEGVITRQRLMAEAAVAVCTH